MNALLVTIGSHGDVHPFVGLGRALRKRGHRVTLLTAPHFETMAREAGLDFESFGSAEHFEKVINDPRLWHQRRGFRFIFEEGILPLIPVVYQAVERHVNTSRQSNEPLVVVAHGIAFGARIAQEKLGVALATVHLAPAVFRSAEMPPVLPGVPKMPAWLPRPIKRFAYHLADFAYIDRLLAPKVNAFRGALGLPPVRGILNAWWNSPQRIIALFPEWFAPPQSDWPKQARLTGFPLFDEAETATLDDDLMRFLNEGEPPIIFTPGSANVHAKSFCHESAKACTMLGRRGVLLTHHPENEPPVLPPGVRRFGYAPFSAVLPHAAALVHHGGIGTIAQALSAGTPQLGVPLSHDQFDNTSRIVRLGTGRYLPAARYTAARAAPLLTEILTAPDVARACAECAMRVRADHPLDVACALVEELMANPISERI